MAYPPPVAEVHNLAQHQVADHPSSVQVQVVQVDLEDQAGGRSRGAVQVGLAEVAEVILGA